MSADIWKNIVSSLPGDLKLLGAALAATGVAAPEGAAVAGLGAILGHALGTDATPDAIQKAIATDPAAAAKLAEVQENNKVELRRIIMQGATAQMAADASVIKSVNDTMEVEDQTKQAEWRQVWGYISAVAFAFCVLGLFGFVVGCFVTKHTEQLAQMPLIIGALTGFFAIPLAVLGVVAWHNGKAELAAAQGS